MVLVHLSSMDTLTSVDDRPYWRDANEGGRNVEPLHCKAHLQLWHKDVAESAMACPCACHHSIQPESVCYNIQTACCLRWQFMEHVVLGIIQNVLSMQQR